MRRWCAAGLLLAVFELAASAARAQDFPPLEPGSRVLLLPVQGDSEIAQRERTAALSALGAALQGLGLEPVAPGAAGCEPPASCEPQAVLEQEHADAVLQSALWAGGEPAQPARASLRLVRRDNSGQAEVALDEAGLSAGLASALARALADAQRRHTVQLRVLTEPAGASVAIDHRPIGRTPLQLDVAAGRRTLTLSAPGYESESLSLELTAHGAQPVVHRTTLRRASAAVEPELAAPDATAGRDDGPAPADLWLSAGLASAALPLLVLSAGTALEDGECVERDPAGRCRRTHFGTRSALMLGAGTALLGAAAAVLVFEPFSVEPGVAPGAASVTLRSRF